MRSATAVTGSGRSCCGSTARAARTVASDTIWREVVRARAAGTPVVVSMGDVAASGGYYISMAADVIVAQPGTITGRSASSWASPCLSRRSSEWVSPPIRCLWAAGQRVPPTHPFSEDEWERINIWLDAIYHDFTAKVASGRRMTVEQVDDIARGRVWTGADAARNGLVDELGGMSAAADITRRRAGLPADAPLRVYPRLTPLDQLRPLESSESRAGRRGPAGPRLRGRVGPGVAVRGCGWPVAVRTADAPRPLDHPLTERQAHLGGVGFRRHAADRGRRAQRRRGDGQRVLSGVGGSAAGAGVTDGGVVSGGAVRAAAGASHPVRRHDALRRPADAGRAVRRRGRPRGPADARGRAAPARTGVRGADLAAGALAALECGVHQVIPAGDHLLVIARVTDVPYVADSRSAP